MTPIEPLPEHKWLQQLVGEWTYEHEFSMGPEQPKMKVEGSETARLLGNLWVILEASGEMPGGGVSNNVMTLGYDPVKKRFVGTFIGSPMAHLWVYNGALDGNTLTLDTVGPSFTDPNGSANYKDAIELVNPNLRMLTSHVQGDDGAWTHFMTATYRRKT